VTVSEKKREVTKVRALFACIAVELVDFGVYKQKTVRLAAQFGTEKKAKDFSAAASGDCRMVIRKGSLAEKMFKPGKKYYLDFTPAP